MNTILYEEKQSFRQPWLWLLLLASLGGVLAGLAFAPEPETTTALGIATGLMLATVALFYFMRLSVQVEPECVRIRFLPLWKKTIPLADIVRWQARSYRPILEYGGWGIRYSLSSGWAYNVSGNRGVQLELTGGKRILIGSQRADELAEAITAAKGPS
jgi:hypothetical protein